MDGNFDLRVERSGRYAVIHAEGMLNNAALERFSQALTPLTKEECPHIAIDMTQIEYIGSSAIGVLMAARREVDLRKGRIVVGNLSREMAEVLSFIRFDVLFEIVENLDSLIKDDLN